MGTVTSLHTTLSLVLTDEPRAIGTLIIPAAKLK